MRNFSILKLKFSLAVALFIFLFQLSAFAQTEATSERYPVIPYPMHLIPANGDFVINKNTSIVIQNESFRQDATALKQIIKESGGFIPRESKTTKGNSIILKRDNAIESPEGYNLSVTPSNVILSARTSAGLFWGIETIRQLLPVPNSGDKTLKIPAVEIKDQPAYGWRGMQLDVSRHFFI